MYHLPALIALIEGKVQEVSKYNLGFVGAKFRPAGTAIVQQLENRHPVLLVREPENPYDKNAIAVYVPIGYIPKAQAAQWADQFDTLVPRMTNAATLVSRRDIELIIPKGPVVAPGVKDIQKPDDDIPF